MPESMNNQNNNAIDLIEERETSLFDLLFVLKRHQKKIIFIVIASFITTFLYTYWIKPVYKSSAKILIEDSASTIDLFELGGSSAQAYLDNEIEILKSRTTAEKVIEELLESEYRNNLFLFGTREYEPKGLNKHIRNLLSLGLINKLDRKEVLPDSISRNRMNNYINALMSKIKISNTLNTEILNISIESIDPKEAALLVNKVIEVYQSMDLEWAKGEMSNLIVFLEEQSEFKKNKLFNTENEIKSFQESSMIYGVDNNSKLLLNNLMDVESQLYTSLAEKNILNQRIAYIKGKLTDEEKKLAEGVSNTINDRLFALKAEIIVKESEIISATTYQGENHSVVKSLNVKLDKLKANLKAETRNLISKGISVADPIRYRQSLMDSVINLTGISVMYDAKINEFNKLVKTYELKLAELPEKFLEYSRLQRNQRIHADTYSLMRQKLEEARINAASQIGKVRIIDNAYPILKRIKPDKKFNIIFGIIFGLIIGLSISFLIEYFNNTILSIDEIERRNLVVLALIPSMMTDKKTRKTKRYKERMGNAENIQRRLITQEDPRSPISEAFRGLRTNLLYSMNNDNIANVILISSPGPGEGKSTTIVNLAITYANLGKRTLLIDCDLRKPVVHKIFSLEKEPGLTKYISDNNFDDHSKIISKSEISNLDIITCGTLPPNPSEVLASESMDTLIKKLKDEYDTIVIDSPPLLAVTDCFVISKFADHFILVVRANQTEKSGLDRSLKQIDHVGAKFSGVIMNDMDESNPYGQGYSYSYYQYYYGNEKK